MTRAAIRQLAESKLHEHGLSDWRIAFESSRQRCGLCMYKYKIIRLSLSNHSEREILDTILHEVAHALTPGAGHGPDWQDRLIALGGNPAQFLRTSEFLKLLK